MGNGVDEEALKEALPTVGFAKLCVLTNGDDPTKGDTYIVQKYETILGRQSKSSNVDVVLGTAIPSRYRTRMFIRQNNQGMYGDTTSSFHVITQNVYLLNVVNMVCMFCVFHMHAYT